MHTDIYLFTYLLVKPVLFWIMIVWDVEPGALHTRVFLHNCRAISPAPELLLQVTLMGGDWINGIEYYFSTQHCRISLLRNTVVISS